MIRKMQAVKIVPDGSKQADPLELAMRILLRFGAMRVQNLLITDEHL